jgi:hypothetical protein
MSENTQEPKFEIVHEEVKYKRYLCVSDRHVKFPNGKVIKWDVVGHSFNEAAFYVCVFPYDSKTVQNAFYSFIICEENSYYYSRVFTRYEHHDLWSSLWSL